MDGPFRIGMLLSTLALALMAGWRWHEAGTHAPDRITGLEGPGLVFVVRSNDCPDRRTALEAWLLRIGESPHEALPPVAVGVVDGGEPRLGERLAALPRLDRADLRAAGRAVLRGGLDGTPAVLVVDARGYVVLAEGFEIDGPHGRLELVAGVETGRVSLRSSEETRGGASARKGA